MTIPLATLFVSFTISYFSWHFPLREELFFVNSLFVVVFALPAYYGLIKSLSIKRGLVLIFILSIFAIIFEAASIKTGFPYGYFSYGGMLGQKVFDLVPWTVGFAWPPLVLGAGYLAKKYSNKFWSQVFLSTLFLVAIDLILDPGAVAFGYWTWQQPGWWYDIPFTNYLGWALSGVIGSFIFLKFTKNSKLSKLTFLTYLLSLGYWGGIMVWNQFWLAFFIAIILIIISIYPFKQNKKTSN